MIGATFSNAGVTVNSVTPVSRTSCTVNVSVSAGATPGTGTMRVKHKYENDSNTLPCHGELMRSLRSAAPLEHE